MTRPKHVSVVRTFNQADFDQFAQLSGDDNPIHTDQVFSVGTRFGRTVAHGLLLCSVLRGLLDRLVPGGRLREQSVMFPAPTYAGEPMLFTLRLTGEENAGVYSRAVSASRHFEVEIRRIADDTVTCLGEGKVV